MAQSLTSIAKASFMANDDGQEDDAKSNVSSRLLPALVVNEVVHPLGRPFGYVLSVLRLQNLSAKRPRIHSKPRLVVNSCERLACPSRRVGRSV
jgi:hypothetical protein